MTWRNVLDATDEAALRAYARRRPPFDGRQPALLVIDVTESFVGPNLPVTEAQKVSRQACGEAAWTALPNIQKLLRFFRKRSWPTIFTTPDPNQKWVGAASAGFVYASEPTQKVAPEVQPTENELVLAKTKSSAFFGTPLVAALNQRRVDTLVLSGGTTSGCVRATAVDGSSYGYEVFVADDACFDRSQLSHAVSLRDVDAKYARVANANHIMQTLASLPF